MTQSHDPIPEEWLSAYLDEALSEPDRARVEVYLASHESARKLLEELRQLQNDLRQLPVPTTRDQFSTRLRERLEALPSHRDLPPATSINAATRNVSPVEDATDRVDARRSWRRSIAFALVTTAVGVAISVWAPRDTDKLARVPEAVETKTKAKSMAPASESAEEAGASNKPASVPSWNVAPSELRDAGDDSTLLGGTSDRAISARPSEAGGGLPAATDRSRSAEPTPETMDSPAIPSTALEPDARGFDPPEPVRKSTDSPDATPLETPAPPSSVDPIPAKPYPIEAAGEIAQDTAPADEIAVEEPEAVVEVELAPEQWSSVQEQLATYKNLNETTVAEANRSSSGSGPTNARELQDVLSAATAPGKAVVAADKSAPPATDGKDDDGDRGVVQRNFSYVVERGSEPTADARLRYYDLRKANARPSDTSTASDADGAAAAADAEVPANELWIVVNGTLDEVRQNVEPTGARVTDMWTVDESEALRTKQGTAAEPAGAARRERPAVRESVTARKVGAGDNRENERRLQRYRADNRSEQQAAANQARNVLVILRRREASSATEPAPAESSPREP